MRPVGLIAALAIVAVVETFSGGGSANAKDRCHRVRGSSNSLFVSANCNSPVGLCTSGTISGGGPLDGAFVFMAFDAAPAAGMPAVEPAANLAFSGQVTITSRKGTLVTHDLGVLDAVNGFFTEVERPASGTGEFTNPSHDFFISGAVTPAGDGFAGVLSGTLCTDGDLDD